MRDDIDNRAAAVECLLLANRAHDEAEKEAWLALCENWLKLAQLGQKASAVKQKCGRLAAPELPDDDALAMELG
jgi:hypothetical protein